MFSMKHAPKWALPLLFLFSLVSFSFASDPGSGFDFYGYGAEIRFYDAAMAQGSAVDLNREIQEPVIGRPVLDDRYEAKWVMGPNDELTFAFHALGTFQDLNVQVWTKTGDQNQLVGERNYPFSEAYKIQKLRLADLFDQQASSPTQIYFLVFEINHFWTDETLDPNPLYDRSASDGFNFYQWFTRTRLNYKNFGWWISDAMPIYLPLSGRGLEFFYHQVPYGNGYHPELTFETYPHSFGNTQFARVQNQIVRGALSQYRYTLVDGSPLADQGYARIWELWEINQDGSGLNFVETISCNQDPDQLDRGCGSEKEVTFKAPQYQAEDDNLYVVYCRNFNAFGNSDDPLLPALPVSQYEGRTFFFKVGKDHLRDPNVGMVVGFQDNNFNPNWLNLASPDRRSYPMRGWVYISPADLSTYQVTSTTISGGRIIDPEVPNLYFDVRLRFPDGHTENRIHVTQFPQTTSIGDHSNTYFADFQVDDSELDYPIQVQYRLSNKFGTSEWSASEVLVRRQETMESWYAQIRWLEEPEVIVPGSTSQVVVKFRNPQGERPAFSFWLTQSDLDNSSCGYPCRTYRLTAYPSDSFQPGTCHSESDSDVEIPYTIEIPTDLVPSGPRTSYFVEMKTDFHGNGQNPCAETFLSNYETPPLHTFKQMVVSTLGFTGEVSDPYDLTSLTMVTSGVNRANVEELDGAVNFFFQETHSGGVQPETLSWVWRKSGTDQYWERGQWRTYPNGEAPRITIDGGQIEGGGIDPFSQTWHYQGNLSNGSIRAKAGALPMAGLMDAFFGDETQQQISIQVWATFPNGSVKTKETEPFTVALHRPEASVTDVSIQVPSGPLSGVWEALSYEVGALPANFTIFAATDSYFSIQLSHQVLRLENGSWLPLASSCQSGSGSYFSVSESRTGAGIFNYTLTPSTAFRDLVNSEPGSYRVKVSSGYCNGDSLFADHWVDFVVEPGEAFVMRFHYRDQIGSSSVSRAYKRFRDPSQSGEAISLSLGNRAMVLYPQAVEITHFEPFGTPLASSSNEDKPRFTGHEFDRESGFNYMKGRFQMAMFAKFNRPDPIRDWDWTRPQTLNLYQYTYNDPINLYDPDGYSPVSMFFKFVAKRGLVKGAKSAVRFAVRQRLKKYRSKAWARTFADDALTAIDLASGQSWWEYGIEFLPYAGDVYSGVKMTKQAKAIYGIVERFKTMAEVAAKAAGHAWKTVSFNKKLTGKGVDTLEAVVTKVNNIGEHLSASDMAGAVRDLFGQAVKKSDGSTFDHLKEVKEALKGLGKQIGKLQAAIKNNEFDGDTLKAAERLLKDLAKRKEEFYKMLQGAKKVADAK